MPVLHNVNTTDIQSAIALGCRTMSNVFDADDNDVPFFRSWVLPVASLAFNPTLSEAHVPGRHLNALLMAEDVAGLSIDESTVEKHTAAAFLSYSGSVALPLNRAAQDGPPINFDDHNLREGFHALYALARYRDSSRAADVAASSIDAIFNYWDPESGWDRGRLRSDHGVPWPRQRTFIEGIARSIGPLVKLYDAIGYEPALKLARVLADKTTEEYFLPSGEYNREKFGTHTHSTTCVMSSLAQLADVTGDEKFLERAKSFYENGLNEIRDEIGWVIESSAGESPSDLGECNNTGDIVETALILGRHGFAGYYQDAELILRCHLLPSQLRDNSFIVDPPNPHGIDGLRSVRDRHMGAFGFPAPYGHHPVGVQNVSFNMDIVGGAVGSLCAALSESTVSSQNGHQVNLLFDRETSAISTKSGPEPGKVTVVTKTPGPLRVRIPESVDLSSPETVVPESFEPVGDYLVCPEPPVDTPLEIRYKLVERDLVMHHKAHDIRVRLLGDTVLTMDSFGANLTFFPEF
jgi:hypothetical protein